MFDTHPQYVDEVLGPMMPRARRLVAEHGLDTAGLVNAMKKDLDFAAACMKAMCEKYLAPGLTIPEMLGTDEAQTFYDWCTKALSRADSNAIVMEHWHWQRFLHEGRKIFEVTPGLAEQLKYTEFRSMTVDVIHAPYKEFYIKTPPNAELVFSSLLCGKRTDDVINVNGLYLAEIEWSKVTDTEVGKTNSTIVKQKLRESGLTEEEIGQARSWRIMVFGRNSAWDTTKDGLQDMASFSFDVVLPPKWTPEQCINLKAELNQRISEELKPLYQKEGEGEDLIEDPSWRGLFYWVFNIVTYATMPGAEKREVWGSKDARDLRDRIVKLPKNSKKRDTLRDRLRAIDPQRRIILGESLKRLEVKERLAGKTTEGRKLIWRLFVTGHWRMQAYGHGYSEHKLIWIQPYWKGPPIGRVANPVRLIEAPPEVDKPPDP